MSLNKGKQMNKLGMRITYSSGNREPLMELRWAVVTGITSRILMTSDGTGVAVAVEDEGKAWIRGWHDGQSEKGKALLAAAALSTGPTGPPRPMDPPGQPIDPAFLQGVLSATYSGSAILKKALG